MTDEGIVHLAGHTVEFDGVVRCRCQWCGALIEERDLRNCAVQIDDTASPEVQTEEADRVLRSTWTGFVEIKGTNPIMKSRVEEEALPDGSIKVPERCCMRVLPREVDAE